MSEAPHRVVNLELLRVWLGVDHKQQAIRWAEANGVKPLAERGPRGETYYRVKDALDAMSRGT